MCSYDKNVWVSRPTSGIKFAFVLSLTFENSLNPIFSFPIYENGDKISQVWQR